MCRVALVASLSLGFAVTVCAGLAGCTQDTTTTVTPSVPKPAPDEPEPEPPPQGPTGFIEVKLDPPVTTTGCYVSLHTFTGGRPAVLKIASYPDPAQEVFPSVLLQAQVAVSSAEMLAGSTVQAEAYVMTAEGTPTWHTNPGAPVEVKITSITGTKVVGEIVSGQLKNPATQATMAVTGKFDGTL